MKKKLYEFTSEEFNKWCENEEGKKIAEEIETLLNDETPLIAYKGICRMKEIFEQTYEVVE